MLVSAIACGEAALDTSAQPHSGEAFTLREIDAMNIRGNALNAAAIALDTVGGAARPAERCGLCEIGSAAAIEWLRAGGQRPVAGGGSGRCGLAVHGLLKLSYRGPIAATPAFFFPALTSL